MVFEKASFQVDIDVLQAELESVRHRLVPHMVSKTYGGWSVTSSNGSYEDGWLKSGVNFDKVSQEMKLEDYTDFVRDSGQTRPVLEYVKPTEACTPYLKTLIESWTEAGLYPCRARLTLLKPGGATSWHQDAPDWMYSVRIHVPIVTNTGCLFETKDEAEHLPSDGSAYFVSVNRQHRVVNRGETDRIHLIANVFDTRKLTRFHQYSKPKSPRAPDTGGD